MARVFLATLRGAGGFEKRLVVKQIRPELASDQSFIGRFVAEAKTTVELSHSNIVPVYELGAERGTYYIAMEYCEGASLNQLLCEGALSPAEGAYIGVEICRALDYAHRKAGIVHRDVTPRNVMIDPEGMVRLIDFGIAASADAQAVGPDPLFGSPGHMPPEQFRAGPLTPAADVFAVGALLVETWTGKPPFRRGTLEASIAAFDEPLPDLADSAVELSGLSDLLRAAVALDPTARPQSAEELARPLREFLRQSDLGDIARRLGRRVTELEDRTEEASAPHTWVEGAAPSALSGATQTFAAREVVRDWTGRIESRPPRLSLTAPLPDMESKTEGFSMPPLPAPRRVGWLWRLGGPALSSLIAAALIMAGWSAFREPSDGGALPKVAFAAASSEVRELPRVPKASATAAPQASSPPAPRVVPALRQPAASNELVRAVSAPLAPPKRVPPGQSAHLHLTAEPRARVQLDGSALGQTPLQNFALSPGRHDLVFVSDVLGEKLSTRVTLEPAETRRVHADFTNATPQIHVR